MGRPGRPKKKKLKTKPYNLTAQRQYCERQYAIGRRARKYWATDEEDVVVKQVLKRVLTELRTRKTEERVDEATEETKMSACL